MRFTLRDLFWLTLLAVVVYVNCITYRAAMQYKAESDAALKSWADAQTDDLRTTAHRSSTSVST